MPKNVKGAIYADDIAGAAKNTSSVNYRLQFALQEIQAWTKAWLVRINEKKEIHTVFSLSNQQPKVKLQINSQPLKTDDLPTYLGVALGRRLTWRNQIHKNQTRPKLRMTLMKMLAGTCWGAD